MKVSPDHKTITVLEYLGAETDELMRAREIRDNPMLCQHHSFKFDYVYDQDSTQAFVYENTAKHTVISSLEGYNATLLAYGQTGTGKTYTTEGFQYSGQHPERGIVPRAMEEIFRFIENSPNMKVSVIAPNNLIDCVYGSSIIFTNLQRSDQRFIKS